MKNSPPFLTKDKDRFFVKLPKALYPEKAVLLFKEEFCKDNNFVVSDQGRHFLLETKGLTEDDCLEALNYLLYLVKKAGRVAD